MISGGRKGLDLSRYLTKETNILNYEKQRTLASLLYIKYDTSSSIF